MKTKHLFTMMLVLMIMAGFMTQAWAQTSKTKMVTQKPVMKMTTPIPENITTSDKIESPIGTLEFFDGVPNRKTIDAVYGYVDRARAVQAFINMTPAVGL